MYQLILRVKRRFDQKKLRDGVSTKQVVNSCASTELIPDLGQ
jgi:hypothetical protein